MAECFIFGSGGGFEVYNNAGAHNCIYRGKYLGDSVTAAQWNAIKNGTFDDLYIGDYWVISGIVWRIAAFNYYYNTGYYGTDDMNCTENHIVIVPDVTLYDYQMNSTNTTSGGYVGSKMYTQGLSQATTIIESAFGAEHILNRREYFCSAVANGLPSSGTWCDAKIWLMTEMNVYGSRAVSPVSNDSAVPFNVTIDKSQYPLFMYAPRLISNWKRVWLRDVVDSKCFSMVDFPGTSGFNYASENMGVRPAFAIYEEDAA